MGTVGYLTKGINGEYFFRVYDKDHNFVDYDIIHSDLKVKIQDQDACFYNGNKIKTLDHAPSTLGDSQ